MNIKLSAMCAVVFVLTTISLVVYYPEWTQLDPIYRQVASLVAGISFLLSIPAWAILTYRISDRSRRNHATRNKEASSIQG